MSDVTVEPSATLPASDATATLGAEPSTAASESGSEHEASASAATSRLIFLIASPTDRATDGRGLPRSFRKLLVCCVDALAARALPFLRRADPDAWRRANPRADRVQATLSEERPIT